MRWLARVAAATVVRRLVGIALVALLALLGMGQGRAQAFPGEWTSGNTRYTANQGTAVAQCSSYASGQDSTDTTYNHSCSRVTIATTTASHPTAGGVLVDGYHRCGKYSKSSGSYMGECNGVSRYYWAAGVDCPVGEVWDPTTKTCAPEGPTDEECQAINAQPGFIGVGDVSRDFESRCMENGCTYQRVPGPENSNVCAGSVCTYVGTYEWTGACPSPPPPEAPAAETLLDPPPQTCVTGTNPLVCVKRTGEHCFSASTGKQICWRPGETGTKTDANVAQKRVPGTNPPTAPTPPEGETFTQGPSQTTATTTGGTTITTTTTNFITTGGTDAGDSNDGEADDGESSSASGGGDCGAAPVVSGDAALAMVATQAWHTRCAVEAGNAANVAGDVSDCSQPFTVEGDNANAEQLRALRAQICNKIPVEEQTDGTAGADPGDTAIWQTVNMQSLLEGLDDGGFLGSSACPALPVFDLGSWGTFQPNPSWWCTLVGFLAAFVMFSAAIVSIIIIME